ncbi:uncharacterized protein LOC131015705 isoform X2 [Salvia miltiorrhiza]|uniref:uncharacterized protein LOC131015705 isoform X2 n=1 Tax=Salvia miltiorrhiza TaxID=226208 RepID=UPI0025AC2D08|nr:uncharacterized protein LOC131015705 isoform X2 [Salvia miltiorrhiza]
MENEETINDKSEAEVSDAVVGHHFPCHFDGGGGQEDAKSYGDELAVPEPLGRRKDILKALEAVERDSAAIAESFSSLFGSLRHSLSQATGSTVEHMNCFSDAAGRLQECVLDAATKGNRYINSCLSFFEITYCRLNEEMKDMDALATKLKFLRRHVDALDSVVNRVVRLP